MIAAARQRTSQTPERQLDEMYLTVLANSISTGYAEDEQAIAYAQSRLIVASLVTLQTNLTLSAFSIVLEIDSHDVEDSIEGLFAILDVTGAPERSLQLVHPSFRDFLTDQRRCTGSRMLVRAAEAHQTLAYRCLQVISRFVKESLTGIRETREEASWPAPARIPLEHVVL